MNFRISVIAASGESIFAARPKVATHGLAVGRRHFPQHQRNHDPPHLETGSGSLVGAQMRPRLVRAVLRSIGHVNAKAGVGRPQYVTTGR